MSERFKLGQQVFIGYYGLRGTIKDILPDNAYLVIVVTQGTSYGHTIKVAHKEIVRIEKISATSKTTTPNSKNTTLELVVKHNLKITPDLTEGKTMWRACKVTLSNCTNVVLLPNLGPLASSPETAVKALCVKLALK